MIVGLCVYFSLIAATAGATAASISVIIPTPLATHIAQAVAASPRVLAARAEVAGFKLQAAKADLASVRQAVRATLLNRLASYRTARSVEQIAGRRVNLMKRFTTLAEQRRRAADLG
jgi:hypothetical protein